MLNYLKCMLQLILSPAKGWEDISHDGRDPQLITSRGLFPFLGIVAATCFVPLLRVVHPTVSISIIHAIITFLKYFVSVYIAQFVMPLVLPDYIEGDVNDKRTSTFILYIIGLLAVITLINNLVPMELGITLFLPLYVAIIMWKGARYMAVKPEKTKQFVALTIMTVMLPPFLIGALFNIIL